MPGESITLKTVSASSAGLHRKFKRQYILKVETNFQSGADKYVQIAYPITVEFTISRHNCAAANTAQFVIYNLAPSTRSLIYKDLTDLDSKYLRAIQFYAGYADAPGDLLPQCLNGTIKQAYSQRSGSDFKTTIEAYDGMPSTGIYQVSRTIPAGTPQAEAIATLANDAGVKGKMTISQKFDTISKRAASFMGSPLDQLSQASNGGFYIDSGNAYALDVTDIIPGDIQEISEDNGLLGTPKKGQAYIDIEMLFEPRLKPSQLINLVSATEPRFNGTYKVTGIVHRGTISGATCGDCRTTVTMLFMRGYSIVYDRATQQYTVNSPEGA